MSQYSFLRPSWSPPANLPWDDRKGPKVAAVMFTEDPTGVVTSFFLCGSVFMFYLYQNGSVRKSCDLASMFHHVTAMVIALAVIILNWDELVSTNASYAYNSDHKLVNTLQYFNIGYFLYDSIHVLSWDRKFIPHHAVAIAGFGLSDVSNVFGLANAVNTFITEMGSVMYNYYNSHKSTKTYIVFVAAYSVSRLVFLAYSVLVFYQALTPPLESVYPWWAPLVMISLQARLFVVNLKFLLTHCRKLRGILRKQREETGGKCQRKAATTTTVAEECVISDDEKMTGESKVPVIGRNPSQWPA